jgi:putative transposase
MDMSTMSNPYRGYRIPAEIINQAVWSYHCFSLSLREVELILAARGIVVSYETSAPIASCGFCAPGSAE